MRQVKKFRPFKLRHIFPFVSGIIGLSLIFGIGLTSCGGTKCGPGTTLQDGFCVPIKNEVVPGEKAKEAPILREEATALPDEPISSKDSGPKDDPIPEPVMEQPIQDNVGTAKVGESCDAKKKCEVGPCLRDGYCTGPCKQAGDCPVGMECKEISHRDDKGEWKTFTGCVRPAPKDKACTKDADCPSQQVCIIKFAPGGDKVLYVCAAAVGGGKLPGQECNTQKGPYCRNNMCISDAFCSAICVQDSDCPKAWKCDKLQIPLPNGKQATVPACTPGQKACERDGDCPSGNICRSFLSKDQTKLDKLCSPINRSGAISGDPCDPKSSKYTCYNHMCIDAGFCMSLCKENADCRAGFVCTEIEAQLPKGKAKLKGCTPQSKSCAIDADCDKGFICAISVDQVKGKVVPYCTLSRLYSKGIGEACQGGSTDPRQQCHNHMCLGYGYCSSLCKVDKDCPTNFKCVEMTVDVKPGVQDKIKGCIKK